MPKINEIRVAKEIGRTKGRARESYNGNKFIWHGCVDCGKERWVEFSRGKPRNLRCRHCGAKFYGQRHLRERSTRWKGGKFEASDGYILIRLYPDDLYYSLANSHHYIMEHRLVMARHLGRVFYPHETVHHKNGVKNDNRLENLELWVSRHPYGQRVEDLLEFAYWAIDCYGAKWIDK